MSRIEDKYRIVDKYSSLQTKYQYNVKFLNIWIILLLVALFLPSALSFSVGSLRLTPYRLVLVLSFFPSILYVLSGKAGKVNIADKLIFFHIVWSFVVIAYHHTLSISIESGGVRMLELLGAYLVGRAWIVDARTYRGAIGLLLLALLFLAPFAVLESLTGINLIQTISAKLTGSSFVNSMEPRMGLHRAYSTFDHPILFGVSVATLTGIGWYEIIVRKKYIPNARLKYLTIIVSAICSLSSGAFATMVIQFILLFWEKISRQIKSRWKLLSLLIFIVYMVVDLLSNRSGMKVFLSYLTFSPHTAYNRITIFNYGIVDVIENPVFGIGFNEWSKPSWMHSSSMDNFWLLQAVTYGVPGFVSITGAVLVLLAGGGWKTIAPDIALLRTGWTISIIGITIGACTVHLWNNSFVFFSFLLGAGAWFSSLPKGYKRK